MPRSTVGAMSSLTITLAEDDADTAVALVPSTVPSTWVGPAAQNCQTSLDVAVALLSGLGTLLDTARTAVADMESAGDQSGAES